MQKNDPLFEPLTIGNLVLKNRIMSTSHASGMDDFGMPAERYQRYHEEKAKGGLALTMFGGSSNVSPDSPSVFGQLCIDDDEIIPHLQSFSDRIHQHGTALMCQITHLGRRGDFQSGNWLPMVSPSNVRETIHRNFPKQMDDHDIARIVKDFGQAARRCLEGGLDGLETVAGGHLIGQFFSQDTNLRTDKFGGSIENRARFALMVHEEIRKQVGDNLAVGIRISIDEGPGRLNLEDALAIAKLLESEGTIDFFNCNMGRMDTELALAQDNMPVMTVPLAPHLESVGNFRKEVGLPVFHAARITDVATARHAIRDGLLDMVAMTRGHFADPNIANKIKAGEEDRIRPCIGAAHCMYIKPHCIHNPATGREIFLPQVIESSTSKSQKIVVVGGGPGGLEAARVCAERGHNVVLFEAASQLGGQILIATKASWRRDLISIVDWRIAELEHLGVEVRLNNYAEASDILAEDPNVVFTATGGIPNEFSFDGGNLCHSVWEILSGQIPAKTNILICDETGRHPATSCADHLATQGSNVTLITIDDRVATEMGYAERSVYRKRLHNLNVEMISDYKITTVHQENDKLVTILTNQLTGQTITKTTDQIIIENGTQPVNDLFHDLREASLNNGVTNIDQILTGTPQHTPSPKGYTLHQIGDAITSRSIHAAMLDAYRIAVQI